MLVSTDSCNAFSFVNAPRHRRIGEAVPEPKQPEVKPQKEVTADEQTEEENVEEEKVVPETTLPEPEEEPVDESKLDPHIKIVIHSAPWCQYCPKTIEEAEKLKEEYEVVVEEHEHGFRTDYGYYINSFPYIEFYYDGKIKLYSYGYRTEAQLRKTIQSLSK